MNSSTARRSRRFPKRIRRSSTPSGSSARSAPRRRWHLGPGRASSRSAPRCLGRCGAGTAAVGHVAPPAYFAIEVVLCPRCAGPCQIVGAVVGSRAGMDGQLQPAPRNSYNARGGALRATPEQRRGRGSGGVTGRGFRPGQSGNPTGRGRATLEFRDLARTYNVEVGGRIVGIGGR
jgi:hypothetical protein